MTPIDKMPSKGVTGASPTTAGNGRNYRKGSTGLFSGLINQKRNEDGAAQARRASFNDMKPATGFIGRMWNNYIMGPTSTK